MNSLHTNTNSFIKTILAIILGILSINNYAQNLEDITLIITFENPPANYSVTKAPLKYNKRFALSMQIDDGDNSIFNYGYPVFKGGQIGATTYPGMYYSDGSGNLHSFKMTSAIYMFSGVGTDVHTDPGSGIITWQQLDTLYQNNWGIANKGINTDATNIPEFINYSIERNKSYCRRNLFKSTPGGVIPSVFVNPGGNNNWTIPALDFGNICALNVSDIGPLGDFGGNANDPSLNWAENKYNLFRVNPGNQNIKALADSLSSQSVNGANFWSPIYTNSIYDDYVFGNFLSDFNYIENKYGSNGTDEILMTTDEEILDYLIIRDAITVNNNLSDSILSITFNGILPKDLLYYSSSIVINSNETIANVTIEGTEDYSVSSLGDTSILINIDWDEYVVQSSEVMATTHTSTAVVSQTEYDALIAMDYVTVLEYGETKNNLINQLCEISGVSYDEGFCNSGYPDFVNISGDSIILTGQEALLQATDFMESYFWSNGQTTQSIKVSPHSNTKYWVDAVTAYGNNVSDTILVTVSDSYIISNSSLFVSHTPGTTDSLWVTLKNGASSSWSNGSTLNYILVNPNITTAYHLDVLVDNIIVNYLDFVVYIDNVLEFTYSSVCFGDTTTLINTSFVNDSITKIQWDLTGNTQFDDAEGDTVKYVFNETGNHLVGMRVYFKTDPMDIVYNAVPVGDYPNVDFKYENTCQGSQTIFTDLSTLHVGSLNRWYWRFGDGKTDDNQNTSNYFTAPGNYNVMLTSWSSYGCKDSLQKIVQITNAPSIILKTNYDSIVNNNDTVYFQKGETVTISVSNFANYDSVIWFNNDRAEFIIIAEEGSYYVDAYQNGCSTRQNFSTSWGSSPPTPPVGNDIMNLFTPNGDGYNDSWVVNDPNIVPPTKVHVYNRSGKLIYSNINYQNTWDGQYEGNPLPQATYYYIIEDASGQIFKGGITIIR